EPGVIKPRHVEAGLVEALPGLPVTRPVLVARVVIGEASVARLVVADRLEVAGADDAGQVVAGTVDARHRVIGAVIRAGVKSGRLVPHGPRVALAAVAAGLAVIARRLVVVDLVGVLFALIAERLVVVPRLLVEVRTVGGLR